LERQFNGRILAAMQHILNLSVRRGSTRMFLRTPQMNYARLPPHLAAASSPPTKS
jgi:hypothetical protein